jgi:hypothetical protein
MKRKIFLKGTLGMAAKDKFLPGWTKAVYGAIAGKEVKVDFKSSIKHGDPTCRIEVDLS